MLTIPGLTYMTYHFCYKTNEEVQNNYYWFAYLYLLAIFVSLTNQVRLALCYTLLQFKLRQMDIFISEFIFKLI